MRNCPKTPSFEAVERHFASESRRSSYLHPPTLTLLCAEPRLFQTYVSYLKILILFPSTIPKRLSTLFCSTFYTSLQVGLRTRRVTFLPLPSTCCRHIFGSYKRLNMIISNKPLINQDILVCLLALVHNSCKTVEIIGRNISELFVFIRKKS